MLHSRRLEFVRIALPNCKHIPRRLTRVLAGTVAVLLLGEGARATTSTWTGGTSSDWTLSGNWGLNPPAYGSTQTGRLNITNGAGNGAIYDPVGQGAGNVTTTFTGADDATASRGLVIGNASSGSLTINSGTLAIQGTSSPIMANNASASLTINGGTLDITGNAATFQLVLSGSASATSTLTVAGTGSFIGNNVDLFTGGTGGTSTINLNGGSFALNAFSRTVTTGATVINLNGGILRARTNSTAFLPSNASNTANVQAGGALIDTQGFNITISQPLIHDSALGATVDGGLTKSGNGTLTLSGNSTYTGATTVNAGTLQLGNNSTNGTIAGSLSMAAGTTLAISHSDTLAQSTFTGAGAAFQSGLTGDVSFTKAGGNIFTIDVANSYTGATNVTAGILRATNSQALGSTAGATTVSGGAAVALSGITVTGETITINGDAGTTTGGEIVSGNRGALQGSAGNSEWAGNVSIGATTNTRIGIQDGANLTVSGNITDGGASRTIIFRGAPSAGNFITLTGAGNQWGRTEIYGDTTRIGGNNILPTGAPLAVGITAAAIPQSVFDLNGFNQKVAGLTQASSSTGIVTNNGGADSVLTIEATTDQIYQGILTDGATKKLSLVKNGSFKQTLTGANTFTGATTVNAGTLLVNGSVSGSAFTVNGGTVGGTGTITGPVTIASGGSLLGGDGVAASDDLAVAGSVIFGDGSIIQLTLGASNAHSSILRTSGTWTFDADQAFTFVNPQAGSYNNIISGLAADPVTAAWTLTNAGYTAAFTYDGSGGVDLVVAAVPEPGAVISLAGGVGMLLGLRRSRRR